MLSEGSPNASLAQMRKSYQAGFWAAIVAAITPFLIISLVVGSIAAGYLATQFGSRGTIQMLNLFGYLQSGLSLLGVLAFVVVMASLRSYAQPEKRVWVGIGLILAVVFGLLPWIYYLARGVQITPFYDLLALLFPALPSYVRPIAFETLGYALMGLAGLFALPAFRQSRLERAIRWCLAISGVLLIAFGVGLAFGWYIQPNPWLYFASQFVRLTLFPLAMAMIAVVFKRARRSTAGPT